MDTHLTQSLVRERDWHMFDLYDFALVILGLWTRAGLDTLHTNTSLMYIRTSVDLGPAWEGQTGRKERTTGHYGLR